MTIHQLVGQNKLKEAIALIEDENERVLLLGRLNSLERDERLGTMDYSTANIQRNRITQAILSHAKGYNDVIVASYSSVQQNTLEDALNAIVRENKRRRPSLALLAEGHLKIWREYHDEKRRTPSFDVTGRRLKVIEADVNEFLSSLDEAKKDDLEAIVERVNKLIEPVVPSWNAIEEAYTLLVGRGFDDAYIRRNVELQPDDMEAKIKCAENIENYLARL